MMTEKKKKEVDSMTISVHSLQHIRSEFLLVRIWLLMHIPWWWCTAITLLWWIKISLIIWWITLLLIRRWIISLWTSWIILRLLLRRWSVTLWTINTCRWYITTWLLIITEWKSFLISYASKRTYTVAGGWLRSEFEPIASFCREKILLKTEKEE